MKQHKTVSFSAKLASLHPMLHWAKTHLKKSGLPDIEIGRIELALEEALVNIISYSYHNDQGTIELEYNLKPKEQVEFTIKDRGRPFDPLQYKTKNSTTLLSERKEGGLGILLIKNLVSKVTYIRCQKTNILKLIKLFTPPTQD